MSVSISRQAFALLDQKNGVADGQIRLGDLKSLDKDGNNNISAKEAEQAGLDPKLFGDDIKKLNQVMEEFKGFNPSQLVFKSPTSLEPPQKASAIQPVQRVAPNPTPAPPPPVPGSPEYQKLIAQSRAPSLADVEAFASQFDIPILRDNANRVQEACLDLGRFGPVGIAVGTVSATTVEFFVPTNLIDIIPGGKVVRKGKRLSTMKMSIEEFKALTKTMRSDLASRIPSLGSSVNPAAYFKSKPTVIHVEAGRKHHIWSSTLNGKLQPNTSYMVSGFQYNTNRAGLVESVSGELGRITPGSRSKGQQSRVGNSGLPDDEGGHMIATVLGGAGEAINLYPQNTNFNRQAWISFENMLRDAASKGPVGIKIEFTYGDKNMPHRPQSLDITYTINGVTNQKTFTNRPGGQ
ncbi:MAG: DNA/RNA non-specific endonuclease [Candidatus Sericytochromatia bacterium]